MATRLYSNAPCDPRRRSPVSNSSIISQSYTRAGQKGFAACLLAPRRDCSTTSCPFDFMSVQLLAYLQTTAACSGDRTSLCRIRGAAPVFQFCGAKCSVSTVFKAAETATGRPLVIKAYHKAKMQEKHLHKLSREVDAMKAMQGEYVVTLYATFQVSAQRLAECMRITACSHMAPAP